jgi:hypothetical protein
MSGERGKGIGEGVGGEGDGAVLGVGSNQGGSGGEGESIGDSVAGVVVGKQPLLTGDLLGAVDDLRVRGGVGSDHARSIGTKQDVANRGD